MNNAMNERLIFLLNPHSIIVIYSISLIVPLRFPKLKLTLSMVKLDEWHVLLKRYRLMESSHGELGSNSHIILDQNQVFIKKSYRQINPIFTF